MYSTKRSLSIPSKGAQIPLYKARRSRGLVWVCDVAGSSRLLNRNETAAATEEFLQRFLYLSLLAVNSGGGTFIKWTGDGFLAFYETPLDRELGSVADLIFHSAWMLTLDVNVTQLCSPPKERIRIRHAVTYEKDALLIDLEHSGDMKSKDVLGRSVVAAFRLSGISCHFPGVVTHREVLRAIDDADLKTSIAFKALPITAEMRLRFFKGEKFGSRDVYVSADRSPQRRGVSLKSAQKKARDVLRQIESGPGPKENPKRAAFSQSFANGLLSGPPWCKQVLEECNKGFFSPGVSALRAFTALDASRLSEVKKPGAPPSTQP
jgi:class 3 adenylate cyclase